MPIGWKWWPKVRRPERRRPQRQPPPTLLIISQDTGGVFQYLRMMLDRNKSESGVSVRVVGMGVTSKSLVQAGKRALSAGSDTVPKADFVLIAFDRDYDPHFADSVKAIYDNPRMIAFASYPCFEYFFVLHFEATRRYFASPDELLHFLKQYPGFEKYSKEKGAVPVVELSKATERARRNAALVRSQNKGDGAESPATSIDLLLECVDYVCKHGLEALVNNRDKFLG